MCQATSWRWAFYFPAIINSALLICMIFFFPETLFSRAPEQIAQHKERSMKEILFDFRGNVLRDRNLTWRDYVRPFYMMKYPSVTLLCVYYTLCFAYGSILAAVTVANIYNRLYGFNTGVIGLILGLPLLIGSAIGEIGSGPFSDLLLALYAKRHDGYQKPEVRLKAGFASAFFVPAGLIIFGVCVQRATFWFWPTFGLAVGSLGLQLISTVTYAYLGDCYKPQSAEISCLFNFARQTFSFIIPFYQIPFAMKVGYDWAWITWALLIFASSSVVVLLYFKGEKWRATLGAPQFHKDI